MAHSGGIFAINPAPFNFDIENFKTALRKQWPDVVFHDDTRGGIDFGMTLKGNFNHFLGSTLKNDSIMWWADYEEFAEFIVWFRKYVPDEYQLLAHNKHFSNQLIISPTTSETEVLQGLSRDRYDFELTCSTQSLDTHQIFEKNFKQKWPDSFFFEDGNKGVSWFLKSQQGHIELNHNSVYFSENDLDFAAQFVIWVEEILTSNLQLTAKGNNVSKIKFTVNITPQMTQQELLTRFIEEFQPTKL